MPRKQHVCADCPSLCRGLRCSPCAHAYGLRNYRPLMPNQPSVGEHLGVPSALLPQSSWWTDADNFYTVAREQFTTRLSRGSGINYQPQQWQL
jgi:hypothetical protein